MVGKNPHRPEGKARADNEHLAHVWHEGGVPRQAPSQKALHEQDLEMKDAVGSPTSSPAMEPIGGSRPGVPSRVQEAIERRLEREGGEE